MKDFRITELFIALVIVLTVGVVSDIAYAQVEEPDVVEAPEPMTPMSEGYTTGIGFDIMLNNFGFGVGGYVSRTLSNYTEFSFQTGITGLRDVSEQTFQSFFTGNRIIPNKYKRGFGFPFLFGIEQRIFAHQIQDNFRLFVGAAAGPAMAFTYPYLDDSNDENGFRDYQVQDGFLIPREGVNDFFTGWSDGETTWGYAGELKIGADLGSSFGTRTTIEFGYFFYYFSDGLQMMEPYRPYGYNESGSPIACMQDGSPIACSEGGERRSHFDAQKYFGTPQIKFTFGGMW